MARGPDAWRGPTHHGPTEPGGAPPARRANLDRSGDWIVLNRCLATLALLARQDPALLPALRAYLHRLEASRYRSLANRARKLLAELS